MEINTKAPVIVSQEITVHSSPEQVWKILTDIKSWNTWFRYIQKPQLEKKKQPLAEGSLFRWQLRSLALTSTITGFFPPHRLSWRSKGSGTRSVTVWSLQAVESGTLVRCEQSIEGLMVLLFKAQTLTAMQDVTDRWLFSLKETLNPLKRPVTAITKT
ncbi:MAG: SRPBCC family protein [Anaerolineales bacterium]|nr:SRPBCC family protein [Anaerolineales bacterium]